MVTHRFSTSNVHLQKKTKRFRNLRLSKNKTRIAIVLQWTKHHRRTQISNTRISIHA